MDTQRFDQMTVVLARGGSRRKVLRGLVGGVLGAVAVDRMGQSAPVAARPVANGCGHAGRICTADETTGPSGTCCGNEKLTCAAPGTVSNRCSNPYSNFKCAAPVGTKCQGHCECLGIENACIKGTCQADPRYTPAA
jgi:hypothetical protein